MEKKEQKLKDLLEQLQKAGIDVKDISGNKNIADLKESSNITKETLDKLASSNPAAFEAWVAWTKSF
jgi:hypothetical protein